MNVSKARITSKTKNLTALTKVNEKTTITSALKWRKSHDAGKIVLLLTILFLNQTKQYLTNMFNMVSCKHGKQIQIMQICQTSATFILYQLSVFTLQQHKSFFTVLVIYEINSTANTSK